MSDSTPDLYLRQEIQYGLNMTSRHKTVIDHTQVAITADDSITDGESLYDMCV